MGTNPRITKKEMAEIAAGVGKRLGLYTSVGRTGVIVYPEENWKPCQVVSWSDARIMVKGV